MLQIRLSKGPSLDGGGVASRSASTVETVTVACPEHLVIADLPIAKSVGAVTASAAASARNISRRSHRQLGDRIHFCVRCDFPIAIYGRLQIKNGEVAQSQQQQPSSALLHHRHRFIVGIPDHD